MNNEFIKLVWIKPLSFGGGGGGGGAQVSSRVDRKAESSSTGTQHGRQRKVSPSMFQTRTATQGASIFGGTKQTLG